MPATKRARIATVELEGAYKSMKQQVDDAEEQSAKNAEAEEYQPAVFRRRCWVFPTDVAA